MATTIFSTTLQALRKKQGVTQEQLANYLGVSAQAVSKWENGSYPEGDLLPKISDFFGVSISYLYGQEKEEVSVEQMVLNELMEICDKANYGEVRGKAYIEKILDIAWAFQLGGWKNNKTYYQRDISEEERTVSVLSFDAGFSFFNLNRNKQFVMISSEPEGGYAQNLEITEDARCFFEMFGKPGTWEIVSFLLTLRNGEFVTAATIAKNVGLNIDKTKDILNKITNPHFVCVDIVGTESNEVAYGINTSCVGLYLGLIMIVDQLINPPRGYQMQINSREKSYMNREDVINLIKQKKKVAKDSGTV